jgi:hypothetical protein
LRTRASQLGQKRPVADFKETCFHKAIYLLS